MPEELFGSRSLGWRQCVCMPQVLAIQNRQDEAKSECQERSAGSPFRTGRGNAPERGRLRSCEGNRAIRLVCSSIDQWADTHNSGHNVGFGICCLGRRDCNITVGATRAIAGNRARLASGIRYSNSVIRLIGLFVIRGKRQRRTRIANERQSSANASAAEKHALHTAPSFQALHDRSCSTSPGLPLQAIPFTEQVVRGLRNIVCQLEEVG
jgi:hypothetical protein